MATDKLHFETLQLHVGQNRQTQQPTLALYLFIKLHRTYSITRLTQRHVSACKTRETSTDD